MTAHEIRAAYGDVFPLYVASRTSEPWCAMRTHNMAVDRRRYFFALQGGKQ